MNSDDENGDRNSLKSLVAGEFGAASLYEIIGAPRDASPEEIKKCYRKKALLYHPDKPGGSTSKFQALSAVHSILADPTKRKHYDATGDIDDVEEISEEFEFWYNYYRSLFPKMTLQQIDEFSAKYKNSEEECNDIIDNYNKFNGDMTDIMENVMLAEEEDETRVSGIIDAAIDGKRLKLLPSYSKYKKSNKKNYKKRKDVDLGNENEDGSNHAAGPSLASLILSKSSNTKNTFDGIFSKYGGGSDSGKGKKGKDAYDIDDAEFAKIQSKLKKR